MELVDTLILFASMLSKTLGKLMQITVSDTQKYLFVENPVDASVEVGSAISSNERHFLENEDISGLPFVVNYKSLSTQLNKLRSSTFFFKDKEDNIQYMISLTAKVDEFLYLREMIEVFVNGSLQHPTGDTERIDRIPKLDLSVTDLIDQVVMEGQKRYGTQVERMTRSEKHSLLREMFSRGVFLIKGAVSEAAKKLSYSEATVYKFLQATEKKNEKNH